MSAGREPRREKLSFVFGEQGSPKTHKKEKKGGFSQFKSTADKEKSSQEVLAEPELLQMPRGARQPFIKKKKQKISKINQPELPQRGGQSPPRKTKYNDIATALRKVSENLSKKNKRSVVRGREINRSKSYNNKSIKSNKSKSLKSNKSRSKEKSVSNKSRSRLSSSYSRSLLSRKKGLSYESITKPTEKPKKTKLRERVQPQAAPGGSSTFDRMMKRTMSKVREKERQGGLKFKKKSYYEVLKNCSQARQLQNLRRAACGGPGLGASAGTRKLTPKSSSSIFQRIRHNFGTQSSKGNSVRSKERSSSTKRSIKSGYSRNSKGSSKTTYASINHNFTRLKSKYRKSELAKSYKNLEQHFAAAKGKSSSLTRKSKSRKKKEKRRGLCLRGISLRRGQRIGIRVRMSPAL